MKSILLILLSLSFWTGSVYAGSSKVVLIVIDQMRADYLDHYKDRFQYGFKTLLEKSRVYANAEVGFVPSDTAPGHATIATGVFPKDHGIVGNRWWDRENRKQIDIVTGGDYPSASWMRAPAFADRLKSKHPDAVVAAFSMKDRAAVFLAGSKADTALWFDEQSGAFVASPDYGGVPAWAAAFNEANRVSKADRFFLASPASDRLLFELVKTYLKSADPDLLMVSFSGVDYTGHRYGPGSEQMEKQVLEMDEILGELIRMLDGTVFILTSDHGVMEITNKTARVRSDRFEAKLEATLQRAFPVPESRWVVRYFAPHLYLNRDLVDRLGVGWDAFLVRAALALEELEEVAWVYNPGREGLGDPYLDYFERGTHPARSGDLLLRTHPHTLIKPYFVHTGHGSSYDYDQRIPLIIRGPGFRPETIEEKVDLTIIADLVENILEPVQ